MDDYYSVRCQEYHEKTFHIDPSSFLKPLCEHLGAGSSVLDVGCGSGRDLLWLKKAGFEATGLERSAGLASLARDHAGCSVIEADFETYSFPSSAFDAILLVGALVHVPHARLENALSNIMVALKEGGFVLLSLKEGTGKSRDATGRLFYLWEESELRQVFWRIDLEVVSFFKQQSKLNADDTWLTYVMKKSRRS